MHYILLETKRKHAQHETADPVLNENPKLTLNSPLNNRLINNNEPATWPARILTSTTIDA